LINCLKVIKDDTLCQYNVKFDIVYGFTGDNKQLIDQYIPVMMQCVEKAKVGAVSVAVLEEAVMLL
jgi:hypothetical protein